MEVDEHHTIEDTAIALGEVFAKALGNKLGIERYGFCLPMDDCLSQVAIDFGGRNWLVWETEFKRANGRQNANGNVLSFLQIFFGWGKSQRATSKRKEPTNTTKLKQFSRLSPKR